MEFHPIANIFPLLDDAELAVLAKDIRDNGLQEPVVVYQEKILDGRNRFLACEKAGVEPTYRPYLGDDPLTWVISENLHRRHLNESDRAMVAANIENLKWGGQDRFSQDANWHLAPKVTESQRALAAAELAESPSLVPAQEPVTRAQAAGRMNVSVRSVARAAKVIETGDQDLIKAVHNGLAVSVAAQAADLPAEERAEVIKGKPKQVRSQIKRKLAVARTQAVDIKSEELGKFPVLYADPPWQYDHPPAGDDRAVENHYPTMSIEEICALPIAEIAHEDAVLYLWTTVAKLEESFSVLEAWGFQYVTNMVWVKNKIGTGYHARGRHEHLLIARRGKMPAPGGEVPDSVIEAQAGRHSEKPVVVYDIIDRLYPNVRKVELFCRRDLGRPNWSVWGNEV